MNEDWDVIIVGAGSAGLPAAILAAERGARVLEIEADQRVGGTLHLSSGQISAAGTSIQKKLGIDDSAEAHYQDVQRLTHNTVDPVLGRLATGNAADTVEWLLSLGFEVAAGCPVAGRYHDPYTVRRYLWGNNEAISILEAVQPVHDRLVAEGKIDLRLSTRLTKLLVEDGAAVGVEVATPDGQRHELRGKNVVLTTGGYASNPELWHELTPHLPLRSRCNPVNRGEGLVAAREIGARVDGEEKFLCTFAGWLEEPENPLSARFLLVAPDQRRPWEIYVDVNGRRFLREDHPSIDYLENGLLRQPGMRMFVVFDEGIFQNAPPITDLPEAEYKALFGRHPSFMRADSLDALAERMGVEGATLRATVEEFNRAVDAGRDERLGREFMVRRIERPPFYALGAGGMTLLSPAGVAVNGKLQVLGQKGFPIPNLYAAGEVIGFTRLSGRGFAGGMSLTPALTFGRLLGQTLVEW